jgi:molybdopterin-binding protein
VIAADLLDRLEIAEQTPACAIFPASSVIVGVDN